MGNTAKDEAERRAEELVRVVDSFNDELRLYIGTHWDYTTANASSMELARREIVENIAKTIREVIEGRDRILTDMLSESEAFLEGWRQGAAAQRKADCEKLERNEWTTPQKYLDNGLVQPPSHDADGKTLTPSANW